MFDITIFELVVLLVCGFLVGFSKTTGTSLSSIIIPIMSDVFLAKEATGILGIAFFLASFHAVYHYRQHVEWRYFLPLIPSTLVGLGVGAVFMQDAGNDAIKLSIGIIILAMLAFNSCQSWTVSLLNKVQTSYMFMTFCGLLMGFSSMVANSGSAVLVIYLLIQREPKIPLIATCVTFFFFSDIIKIPVAVWSGVVTMESLKLSTVMIPLMVAGGFAGIIFIKWISEHRFKRLLEIMTFVGGIKLIFRPLLNLI